jgi:hypothetical protein
MLERTFWATPELGPYAEKAFVPASSRLPGDRFSIIGYLEREQRANRILMIDASDKHLVAWQVGAA